MKKMQGELPTGKRRYSRVQNIINENKIGVLKILKEKKKMILIILLIILSSFIYLVYGKYQVANPDNLYKIVSPEKRNLIKTISISGEVVPESEIQLASDISGQITAIFVNVGQVVKKGALIAKIENAAQRATVTQTLGALQSATAQVKSAEVLLDKAINGSTQEDKNISTSQVLASQSGLDLAYESARNALQNAYTGTITAIVFGTDDMINDASSVNPSLAFNTTEYSAKISAQNMRSTAVSMIVKRHKNQSAYILDSGSIDDELQDTMDELITLREFIDMLSDAISGAIVSSTVSDSTISSYTTTLNTARSQVLADITALTNARFSIISADKALHTTKENRDKVFANTREEDIAIAKINVDAAKALELSASGNYQAAKSALNKTYIRSPQPGIIVDIFKEVGEFTSSSVPVVKISSENRYVSALVSEVDIAKVDIGMDVTIRLDAFKDQVFTGIVDFIYPNKQEILGIGYYEIKIVFTDENLQNFTILPGMALDVIVIYESKDDVIAIERAATKKENDKYYIQILNPDKKKPIDQKFSKIFFESGFVGDKYVEVVSGLTKDIGAVEFLSGKKYNE